MAQNAMVETTAHRKRSEAGRRRPEVRITAGAGRSDITVSISDTTTTTACTGRHRGDPGNGRGHRVLLSASAPRRGLERVTPTMMTVTSDRTAGSVLTAQRRSRGHWAASPCRHQRQPLPSCRPGDLSRCWRHRRCQAPHGESPELRCGFILGRRRRMPTRRAPISRTTSRRLRRALGSLAGRHTRASTKAPAPLLRPRGGRPWDGCI